MVVNYWRSSLFHNFRDLFPKFDHWMHSGHPLAPFWLPFGSLWLPFGSLWHPLGDLLAPIGSLLAPVGSLLLPLEVDFITFAASSPHFGSSLHKFPRNPNKGVLSVSFCIEFSFFFFFSQSFRKESKKFEGKPIEDKPLFATSLPRARSGTLPLAT